MSEERRRVIPLVPPKLKKRMETYDIDLPAFIPTFDRIFVYPLKAKAEADTTAGGIVVADATRERLVSQVGVLISAGPKAIEQLYSYGIGIGDIVMTSRLSPWQRDYFAKGRPHHILILRASEVVGCDDLQRAYEAGDLWYEMAADGSVVVCDREEERIPVTTPEAID